MVRTAVAGKGILDFPSTKLGHKATLELAAAMKCGIGAHLPFPGPAEEGGEDHFRGMDCSGGQLGDLASAAALIHPAWIEHQPSFALASRIPVIATEVCGPSPFDTLRVVPAPDASSIASAILALLPVEFALQDS